MRVPLPAWIAASLEVNEGRDPLGLQTTTQDRLMPVLLPGILELTRRARYFSFHAFLLSEYRARRLPADSKSLSAFIKRREWEFGLAVLRCPRKCGSSPVGARRLGRLQVLGQRAVPRGESVESSPRRIWAVLPDATGGTRHRRQSRDARLAMSRSRSTCSMTPTGPSGWPARSGRRCNTPPTTDGPCR